ncbi:MAG: methionyl-tRNA formyltransferase [Gammaproteobacteria bacterium]
MRTVFAGTATFALPALAALVGSDHEIELVITRPDRRAGRGRRTRASPVRLAAEAAGLAVAMPATLADSVLRERLAALAPVVLVVVAYGRLVPPALLSLPHYGALNVHPSLLPRWRGAAPVERAILAGDAETGVAVMRMTDELDAGPIYRHLQVPIGVHETAGELSDRLAEAGAELLLETLAALAAGKAQATPQRGEPNYAARLTVAEARLDFAQSAEALARRIRAFNPRPVAWCECDGERLRLLRAEALGEKVANPPGTIVAVGESGLDIATGEGLLRITELQRAGRKPLPAADFARGQSWMGRRFF